MREDDAAPCEAHCMRDRSLIRIDEASRRPNLGPKTKKNFKHGCLGLIICQTKTVPPFVYTYRAPYGIKRRDIVKISNFMHLKVTWNA